nr:unnamed protein product [Digitaria exilis]
MYILQEIPSPHWANDRKYPYSNPGTHPHVGPTSGDHPVSYRLRPRLSLTQQARQVKSFRDTRFRSDDDHFLDLSLLLHESNELGRDDRAPAGLDRRKLAGDELLRPRHRALWHRLASAHTPSPKTPWRPTHNSLATTSTAAHDGDTPSGQTPATRSRRTHLGAPADQGEHNAPPNVSRAAPERPAHVRLAWRDSKTGNPNPKPSQQLVYEHQRTKGELSHPLNGTEVDGGRLLTHAGVLGGWRLLATRKTVALGSEMVETQRKLIGEVEEFKVKLVRDDELRRRPRETESEEEEEKKKNTGVGRIYINESRP